MSSSALQTRPLSTLHSLYNQEFQHFTTLFQNKKHQSLNFLHHHYESLKLMSHSKEKKSLLESLIWKDNDKDLIYLIHIFQENVKQWFL